MASVARKARRRRQLEDWKSLPWKDVQRNVFRLQKRARPRDGPTKPQAGTMSSASTTCKGCCCALGRHAVYRSVE